MPYLFPYENLFVLGVSLLIVALLLARFRLARSRRRRPTTRGGPADSDHAVQSDQADQAQG